MAIMQALTEIQRDLGGLTAKLDRVVSDQSEASTKLDDISGQLKIAKGFGLAATILIPLIGAFLAWLFSERIDDIRNHLFNIERDRAAQTSNAASNP